MVALVLHAGFQLSEVFNDAVVYDRQFAAGNNVRVRVDIAWATVGSPAGVANAQHRVR